MKLLHSIMLLFIITCNSTYTMDSKNRFNSSPKTNLKTSGNLIKDYLKSVIGDLKKLDSVKPTQKENVVNRKATH